MASRNTPTLIVTVMALGVFAANLVLPESLAGCVLYVGVVLASIYGLMLGMLRNWSNGLAAPVIAHICADATIFVLVLSA